MDDLAEPNTDRIRTWARAKAHGPSPLTSTPSRSSSSAHVRRTPSARSGVVQGGGPSIHRQHPSSLSPLTQPLDEAETQEAQKVNMVTRFFLVIKDILLSSIINVLLVFVPVGMAVHFISMPAGVVFAMNAIAIVPLAGLLSHATESIACRMGDTIGALMNVTFGNAVELIIFIIALVKNEIRIVQASLVGSILANLLLILGMCFVLGGLRFREQIYNSTVTQMSACLLSLSVTSLLLPTAFHASFADVDTANHKVLQVSRGTSVVLLVVYLLYLIFQLRSHSYMYESTPQDIIERESMPGPAAQYFNASSSSSEGSSSSSDSDESAQSGNPGTRIRRMMKRGKKSRKTSVASPSAAGPSSILDESSVNTPQATEDEPRRITLVDRADVALPINTTTVHEAGDESTQHMNGQNKRRKRSNRPHSSHRSSHSKSGTDLKKTDPVQVQGHTETRRVDFALGSGLEAQPATPRLKPFSLRSIRPIPHIFTTPQANFAAAEKQAEPSHQKPLRRAQSMPTRQHHAYSSRTGITARTLPPIVPIPVNTSKPSNTPSPPNTSPNNSEAEPSKPQTSMTTAILLLLVSTGLVAVCAEFMIDSIDDIVSSQSGISEAFIGLILLPVVGNAAEHVTAVTVALKNKMDLAIGVALGSSIQIALFVTPLVVLLGWIMDKDMSLFFTLFETICMFVSAFIVNFLVLDGRSNYLEGALLCAAYVIISVAAFFSPNPRAASQLGGGGEGSIGVGNNVTRMMF
ncbi:vacuolar calcium ion transporter [Apodospora peruviana]|uniref:Vacuolar calcium ion transporter n=1 Tax=Apodospora peruviana TaxID=516989 RepID=A0AAE0MEW6_9PEZI|nr:vacuolar calcium ion transporter [Apodospora peruviana]